MIVLTISVVIGIYMKNRYHNQQSVECRYCTLLDYSIVGNINDIKLNTNEQLNVKDIIWNVYAAKDGIRIVDNSINNCLTILFDKVKYKVSIEDVSIVDFKDNNFIPYKKGKTTANIKIIIDMQENLKCGPPLSFEDTINIKVE